MSDLLTFLPFLNLAGFRQASFNSLLQDIVVVSKFLISDQRSRTCISWYSTGYARGPAVSDWLCIFISMVGPLIQHTLQIAEMSSGRPYPSDLCPLNKLLRKCAIGRGQYHGNGVWSTTTTPAQPCKSKTRQDIL